MPANLLDVGRALGPGDHPSREEHLPVSIILSAFTPLLGGFTPRLFDLVHRVGKTVGWTCDPPAIIIWEDIHTVHR